jgi:hypothetical protein
VEKSLFGVKKKAKKRAKKKGKNQVYKIKEEKGQQGSSP